MGIFFTSLFDYSIYALSFTIYDKLLMTVCFVGHCKKNKKLRHKTCLVCMFVLFMAPNKKYLKTKVSTVYGIANSVNLILPLPSNGHFFCILFPSVNSYYLLISPLGCTSKDTEVKLNQIPLDYSQSCFFFLFLCG